MTGIKRIYSIWHNMQARCYIKKNWNFKYYGGKGIKICREWKRSFKNFKTWALENGYGDDLQIDRIDANGNYCPKNCRWVTKRQQNNNTSRNHYIEYNGKTKTCAEWGLLYNIQRNVLNRRIRRGWDIEKAFTTPVMKKNKKGAIL